MLTKVLIVLCLVWCNYLASAKKFPPYLTLCHRDEKNMNKCLINAVDQIKPHLLNGIPELFIPSMNPFYIPKAELSTGNSFNASFADIEIYNIHKFNLTKMDVQLDQNKMELEILFPRVQIDSKYHIHGRLMVLQISGKGECKGTYGDMLVTAKIEGKRVSRKGKEYFKFVKNTIDVKFGKVSLQFTDLFNGNEELTRQLNKVINDNIETLFDELYPVIKETSENVVFVFVEQIFNHISMDDLFPKNVK